MAIISASHVNTVATTADKQAHTADDGAGVTVLIRSNDIDAAVEEEIGLPTTKRPERRAGTAPPSKMCAGETLTVVTPRHQSGPLPTLLHFPEAEAESGCKTPKASNIPMIPMEGKVVEAERTPSAEGTSAVAIAIAVDGNHAAEAKESVATSLPPVDKMKDTEGAKASAGAKKEKTTPSGRKPAGDRFPLGLARFAASTHVVVGHLFAKGVTPDVYFFGWGFTWVPWFFMLSGFVLFNAHLRRPNKQGVFDYVMRRSVTIYPLYAFSLIPAFAIAKTLDKAPSSAVLVGQSWLLQALVPQWTEHALQSHCWFLSAMVVYWFAFKPLSRLLEKRTLRQTIGLMVTLFVLPWLSVAIPWMMGESVTWYKEHSWGETETMLDIAVIIIKFHPLCFFHVFVLGMLLARLRLLLDKTADDAGQPMRWRLPLEFVAPAGYLGLALVFCVKELQPVAFKISTRVGILLPFQALILFGLAGLPSLPWPFLSWCVSHFDFLENYSFAMYVFQFICYSLWPDGKEVNLFLFLLFLTSTAVVVVHTVQRPVQKWWGNHPRGRWCVPLFLSILLVSLNAITPAGDPNSDLPAMVRIDERMLDTRLPLSTMGDNLGARIINPSLLVHDGQVVIAARSHRMEVRRGHGVYNGSAVTVLDQTWYSDIAIGTATLDEDAWDVWAQSGKVPFEAALAPWQGLRTSAGKKWTQLCVKETFVPENNTLVRRIVTGPEDPKPVAVNGSIAIAFNSVPPMGADSCPMGEAVSQMYFAVAEVIATGQHLRFGFQDEAEKNWIPFTYDGRLHFVYTPDPHLVITAQRDGTCAEAFSTGSYALETLVVTKPWIKIRGSGQAVLINDTEATPSLPQPHYLALIHAVDTMSGRYAHFAYRFSAEPPFAALDFSSQLPLLEAKADLGGEAFAFASGLVVHNRTVVISYGAGDRDARALVLTLDRLDDMFARITTSQTTSTTTSSIISSR